MSTLDRTLARSVRLRSGHKLHLASFCCGAGFTLLIAAALNLTSPLHRTALAGSAQMPDVGTVVTPSHDGARQPSLTLVGSSPVLIPAVDIPGALLRSVELPPVDLIDPIASSAFASEPSAPAVETAFLADALVILPAVDAPGPLSWLANTAPDGTATAALELPATSDATRTATTASLQYVAPMSAVAPSPVKPAPPRLTGKWAPKLSACSRREGEFLPLIIDGKGARAGGATCAFRDTKQAGARWKVVAACTSTTESWTAKVSLHVTAQSLTWTSERGSQNYVRCS